MKGENGLYILLFWSLIDCVGTLGVLRGEVKLSEYLEAVQFRGIVLYCVSKPIIWSDLPDQEGEEPVMGSEMKGRLDNLEITVEGIKEETAAIRRDLQQMMRLMSGGPNHHGGGSEGCNSSVNENREKGDTGGIPHNWRKRVELPSFEGGDPHIWINRVERFFDVQTVAEEDKVELAYISMEGSASYWFKYWREKTKNRTWMGLKAGLINRFGGGFRGTVYEQMATLRQDGTLEEFVRSFEILLGQTQGLSEELIMGFFLAGLREDIKGQVRIQDPPDLMGAIRVARDVEDAINRACGGVWNGVKVNHAGSRTSASIVRSDGDRNFATRTGGTEGVVPARREGSTMANSTNARGNNLAGGENKSQMVRNLPYPEFLKSWEEGRCFRCGGPFAPGHRCAEKSLRVLLLAEDEEELEENSNSEARPLELSACSAEGLTPPKTMKLTGLIGGRRVVVLIDSGASHNFISWGVVEELGLPVAETPTYAVSLGDGRKKWTGGRCDKVRLQLGDVVGESDLILDIAWLAKLGEVVINWGNMSMQYVVAGEKVMIKGDPALARLLGCRCGSASQKNMVAEMNVRELSISKNDRTSMPAIANSKFLTLPTILTLGRVASIPLFVATFFMDGWRGTVVTTSIFTAAAVTDWLDGYIARKMKMKSTFGAFLDPVADKLMVSATLVLLCTRPLEVAVFGQLPWLLIIPSITIIGREDKLRLVIMNSPDSALTSGGYCLSKMEG
ncbi:hypothetical protein V8G54_021818 [Vigna mungo]|uniref:Ty3 transposon capsid-like protein domain-containing protein n=1 Tax=Vigna mungo TaxID=3915 RepID=A0AAQ3NF09_VIGMU